MINSDETSSAGMEIYGDESIASYDAPVPFWLKCTYIFFPILGVVCFFLYWNGSEGFLDRGFWQQLQRAAQTTYPFHSSPVQKDAAERK